MALHHNSPLRWCLLFVLATSLWHGCGAATLQFDSSAHRLGFSWTDTVRPLFGTLLAWDAGAVADLRGGKIAFDSEPALLAMCTLAVSGRTMFSVGSLADMRVRLLVQPAPEDALLARRMPAGHLLVGKATIGSSSPLSCALGIVSKGGRSLHGFMHAPQGGRRDSLLIGTVWTMPTAKGTLLGGACAVLGQSEESGAWLCDPKESALSEGCAGYLWWDGYACEAGPFTFLPRVFVRTTLDRHLGSALSVSTALSASSGTWEATLAKIAHAPYAGQVPLASSSADRETPLSELLVESSFSHGIWHARVYAQDVLWRPPVFASDSQHRKITLGAEVSVLGRSTLVRLSGSHERDWSKGGDHVSRTIVKAFASTTVKGVLLAASCSLGAGKRSRLEAAVKFGCDLGPRLRCSADAAFSDGSIRVAIAWSLKGSEADMDIALHQDGVSSVSITTVR